VQGLCAELPDRRQRDARLKFRKGEIIYCQGDVADCWFEVVSGVVRTCHIHVDGHRQLTGFYYQGDVFGVEGGSREAGAEAVTNVVLSRRAPTNGELVSLGQSRAFELALDKANQCIFLLGRRHARDRVAAFLLIAAKRLEASGSFWLPMSRNDVADHLGLTIHTVSRTISDFVRRGLIELDGPQLVRLLDIRGLREIAGDEVGAAIDRIGTVETDAPRAHQQGTGK